MDKNLIVFAGESGSDYNHFILKHKIVLEQWDTMVVNKGIDLITLLGEKDCDIVFCDAKLADMTGPELLESIRKDFPRVLRILLVDDFNTKLILETESIVNQYIMKSIDSKTLESILNKSFNLRQLFSNRALLAKISSIKSIPSPPETYNNIVNELKKSDCSIGKVADLISKDIGISTRILKMANSAHFGLCNHVDNISNAVKIIGLTTIKSMVMAAGVYNQIKDPGIPGFSIEHLYKTGAEVGARARLISHVSGQLVGITEEAFMAGMLHEIGRLIMITDFSGELLKAAELAKSKNIPLYVAEQELMGVDDTKIGAYLLSLWGLTDTIVETVAYHKTPSLTDHNKFDTLTAVHLGYAFYCNVRHKIELNDINSDKSAIDVDYIKRLGLEKELQSFAVISEGATVTA